MRKDEAGETVRVQITKGLENLIEELGFISPKVLRDQWEISK